MSVHLLGTYVSENKSFKIQIDSANPANGQIDGVYETTYSPEGSFTVKDKRIGNYSWVFNEKEGKDEVPPFNIRFAVEKRPEGRKYCIYDSWTGYYHTNNTLQMDGARSYVNSKGELQVMSLGTLTFSR